MKRNKTNARHNGGGMSPYRRYKKRPCTHCVQVTRESREAAMRGESRLDQFMREDRHEAL